VILLSPEGRGIFQRAEKFELGLVAYGADLQLHFSWPFMGRLDVYETHAVGMIFSMSMNICVQLGLLVDQ